MTAINDISAHTDNTEKPLKQPAADPSPQLSQRPTVASGLDAIDSLLAQTYRSQQPMRTLYGLINLPWWRLAALYVLFLVKNAPVWWLPIAAGLMVDAMSEDTAMQSVAWLLGISVATLVINVPGHVWYMRHISRINRGIEKRLRSALIRRLQQLSMRFHHEQSTGALKQKLFVMSNKWNKC